MENNDIDKIKDIEKSYHNKLYGKRDKLPAMDDIELMEKRLFSPCYDGGKNKYSDNLRELFKIVDHAWVDKNVLDYACGYGHFAIYYALTGATKVSGFDLSDEAIKLGVDRVNDHNLSDKVDLQPMDATDLKYEDNTFDLVIGTAVLHHVIKYPNVFEELHRVMKPGAKAYFEEGLADFFPYKIWWKIKGSVEEGDIPIYSKELYKKTEMFSNVEIIGDNLFYSVKAFLWKPEMGFFRKSILKLTHKLDNFLFAKIPSARKLGSFSYIVLTK